MTNNIKDYIPGTREHATKRVDRLFGKELIDMDKLSPSDRNTLQDSITTKYVSGIVASYMARYLGLVVGMVAPEAFLLLGAVTLSSPANSTTGAWFSITLEKIKKQLNALGMDLTTKLLKADMSANALSIFSGIGYACRTIAYPALRDAMEDPTLSSISRATFLGIVTALLSHSLVRVLDNKEDAAIQFDFNDATLTGSAEAMKRYYESYVSVNGVIKELPKSEGILLYRSIYEVLKAIVKMIDDINLIETIGVDENKLSNIKGRIANLENEYEDSKLFIVTFIDAVRILLNVLGDEAKTTVENKLQILSNASENDNSEQKVKAIITDTVNIILCHLAPS